jgi:hypothetical protein
VQSLLEHRLRRARRTGAAVVGLVIALVAPLRGACTGDCDGDGTVTIAELVILVDLALDGSVAQCPAGDLNDDGAITIEELIAAVTSALQGCPATATAPPNRATPSPTSDVLPSASVTPSVTPAMTPAATGMATASDTAAPSTTATTSPTGSASMTPTRPLTQTVTVSFTATWSPTPSAAPTGTSTRGITATATPTPAPTGTHTVTLTATGTLAPTPTPGLGARRFSLDPQTSLLQLLPDLGTFTGFTGYLDLAAGVPDPVTGLAAVDVTGASDFLSVAIGPLTLCIKPLVPISDAGVLACKGGFDLGITASQDYNIGTVDVNGFTAADCTATGGTVEGPTDPDPGVCNGPVVVGPSPETDSGVGALLIAPDDRFGTNGLPAEVTVDVGPCSQHGQGEPAVFGFVSGVSRATILDANNVHGAVLQHDERGENFSCPMWMQENGPGRLVLSVPAVNGSTMGDLITVFVLDD